MSGRVQSLKSKAVLIRQEVGTGFVVERIEFEGREEEIGIYRRFDHNQSVKITWK